MTVKLGMSISDGNLVIGGKSVLKKVADNVILTCLSNEGTSIGSAFLGAKSSETSSRHVFKLGVLEEFRLLSLFRAKIWWMMPHMGRCGKDIPVESQLLLLEATQESALNQTNGEDGTFYILFLPVLDGQFRSSLQGNDLNELELCIESGDPVVQTSQALEAVFVNAGENPFELITESVKALEKLKGTFVHRERKKMPGILDWFGWCTWDAFYTGVNPEGINQGLKSLADGGTPARFLIIDDGWQETDNEFQKENEPSIEGIQFATRLLDIKENNKFRECIQEGSDDTLHGLQDVIKYVKETYDLKYVYVWHALAGYWGGVMPNAPKMNKYEATLSYPVQSPGNLGNLHDIAMDSLEKYGVGIINPNKIGEFYNDLHSYLASAGIDGVKVDVQNAIETLGHGFGGRASLTRQYQQALEESISRNFPEHGCISCMSHNSDSIYSSKKSAVVRASEDFMPRDSTSQTLHIASVAFNSLLLGEFMMPDWDMFHSHHAAAEYHAAARAVGGCGVYVSDKPGDHDFDILKKLVLPDGSVLRAQLPGRPTRDCLFDDPSSDSKSLLKIWNMNACTGVLGVFNCQGASWSCKEKKIKVDNECPRSLTGRIRPMDVELIGTIAEAGWDGDSAVYAHNAGILTRLSKTEFLNVALNVLEYEVYTISPIKNYGHKVRFAPFGLIDMYNSGASIESLEYINDDCKCFVKMRVRGCGRFGAYLYGKPKRCIVNMEDVQFTYHSDKCMLTFMLPFFATTNRVSGQDVRVEF
eukprot:Gb_26673 [translate_table: standard]